MRDEEAELESALPKNGILNKSNESTKFQGATFKMSIKNNKKKGNLKYLKSLSIYT